MAWQRLSIILLYFPLLFYYFMIKIIQKWKVTRHGNIPIKRNANIDTMLFADDQVLLAKS
jgi:hypothetical protein